MSESITISVRNWDKYNERKDRKNFVWFRFENSFFFDQAVFGLDESAQVTFVFLLCETSKRGGDELELRLDYICLFRKKKPEEILKDIADLEAALLIAVNRREIAGKCREIDAYITGQDITRQTGQDTCRTLPLAAADESKSQVWEAYKNAFVSRYGVEPVRNAAVNSKLKQVSQRLGSEEAPEVAAFFVTHNDQFYVKNMHPVGLLLKDAEKLRTEWVTGRTMTTSKARQIDQQETTIDAFRQVAQKRGIG